MENSPTIREALIAAIEAGDADVAERIWKNSILGQIRPFSKILRNEEEP